MHLHRAKGGAQSAISSAVLRQVEQTDLIQYGLIPEFVGRFPIISSLQARAADCQADGTVLMLSPCIYGGSAGVPQSCLLGVVQHPGGCHNTEALDPERFRVPVSCSLHPYGTVLSWYTTTVVEVYPLPCMVVTEFSKLSTHRVLHSFLQTLTEDELVEVLTKPRNALSRQYSAMLDMSQARAFPP